MDNMKEANTSPNITEDDFFLSEMARDVKMSMIAKIINDLIEEESKENPDKEIIAQLEKEKQTIRAEANLTRGDMESMRNFIDKYSPTIRARFVTGCMDE